MKSWVRPDSPGEALRITWVRGNPWRRYSITGLGIIFPACFSLAEWLPNNYARLYYYARAKDVNDVDWGLACNFIACSGLQRLANVGLDLFAFVSQAFYLAILIIFIIYAIDFSRILSKEATELEIEFWPALLSPDRRRGFEEFEPLLNRTLIIVLVGYTLAYLVRLENLYLTSATPYKPMRFTRTGLPEVATITARSLWEFIATDFTKSIQSLNGREGVEKFLGSLGATFFQWNGWTRQTQWSGAGVILLYIAVVFVLLTTICLLAITARRNAQRYYSNRDAQGQFGRPVDDERKLADDMDVWPIGWLKINRLAAWTLLALASLVFYRIGAIIFVVTMIYLSYRALRVAFLGTPS